MPPLRNAADDYYDGARWKNNNKCCSKKNQYLLYPVVSLWVKITRQTEEQQQWPQPRKHFTELWKVMPSVYLLHSEMVQPDWMLTTDNTYSRTHNAKCGNVAAEWKEKNGKIEGNKTHVGRVKITVEWTN